MIELTALFFLGVAGLAVVIYVEFRMARYERIVGEEEA